MTKWSVEIDFIDVVSTVLQDCDVARFGKVLNDAVNSAFTNTYTASNVA